MTTLAMLGGVFIFGLLFSAAVLWVSARLVRAGTPSYKRAFACAVVITVFALIFQVPSAAIPRNSLVASLVIAGVELAIGLLLIWIILGRMFKISFGRSMLLSVPYLVGNGAFATGLLFALRYCLAAYVIPANSMAPTLIGWHHEASCPHCQAVAIISGRQPGDEFAQFDQWAREPKPGICTKCRRISGFEQWPQDLHEPMRLICNRMITPKRSDVTVFRYPPQPETLYVQRLVGLPGEKIQIKDGAVWINGAKWNPPEDIAGIAYHTEPGFPPREFDPTEREWQLGPDDFFVLGDFTTNSSDSREWGPVPRANLVGVATLIYWPPSAMRILR